jgi:hypothetical protein
LEESAKANKGTSITKEQIAQKLQKAEEKRKQSLKGHISPKSEERR